MQLQSCNQMLQDVAIYFTVLLAKDPSCSDQPVAVLGLQTNIQEGEVGEIYRLNLSTAINCSPG